LLQYKRLRTRFDFSCRLTNSTFANATAHADRKIGKRAVSFPTLDLELKEFFVHHLKNYGLENFIYLIIFFGF
jgi:hypothetical protein